MTFYDFYIVMSNIKSHVDLELGILYGTLLQIRNKSDCLSLKPDLVPVWVGEVNPRQGKLLMSFIKTHFSLEDVTTPCLNHLKRIRKVDDHLEVIIYPYESDEQCASIMELSRKFPEEFSIDNLEVKEVPQNAPPTKELTQQWSNGYWPITWKGNPNHRFLNSVEIDIEQEKQMINTLLDSLADAAVSQDSTFNFLGTLIASKEDDRIEIHTICIASDINNDPQGHSVMEAISKIAEREVMNRKSNQSERGYLCNDMLVYTTHEPCVMCCMALVHSRIGRIIYLKPEKSSGGLESHYQLGDRDGLNWKFEIWRWLGVDELARLDRINENRCPCIEY